MKKLLLVFFLFCTGTIFCQADSSIHQRASLSLGSLRNRYPYPVSDFGYVSPLFKNHFRAEANLRAFGIRSLFNLKTYDLSAFVHYNKMLNAKTLFYGGAGFNLRIRLVHDDRSTAVSSAEPVLKAGMQFQQAKFRFGLAIQNTFYANGTGATAFPEISWQACKRVLIFLRYEGSYLRIYKSDSHQWRHDSFAGVHWLF